MDTSRVVAACGAIGTGATAPILYGIIGDALGVIPAVLIMAGLVLLTLPLSLVLRSYGQLTQGRSRMVKSGVDEAAAVLVRRDSPTAAAQSDQL